VALVPSSGGISFYTSEKYKNGTNLKKYTLYGSEISRRTDVPAGRYFRLRENNREPHTSGGSFPLPLK